MSVPSAGTRSASPTGRRRPRSASPWEAITISTVVASRRSTAARAGIAQTRGAPDLAAAADDEERCRESAVSIRSRSVIECDRERVPFAAEAQVTSPRRHRCGGDEMADVRRDAARDRQDRSDAGAGVWVEELQSAGTFEHFTMLGSTQDGVDRQVDQLGANSAVDDELAELKAELGAGTEQSALSAGEPAGGAEPESPRPASGAARRRVQARQKGRSAAAPATPRKPAPRRRDARTRAAVRGQWLVSPSVP